MIKCRAAGVSVFYNYKYLNNERWLIPFFIYEFIFSFLKVKFENLRNLLFFYLENDKVSEI